MNRNYCAHRQKKDDSNKPINDKLTKDGNVADIKTWANIDPLADELKNPACYLPQPDEEMAANDHLEPMGPIGPWATGKVDWSPMAGLTGTRPVVDRYSITRFSPNEWRQKNLSTLRMATDTNQRLHQSEFNCDNAIMRINGLVEKTQKDTNNNLTERVKVLGKWKVNLEKAIKAMCNEISTLEEERLRLKKSLVILGVPESIVKECIDKRLGRPDTELVRDLPEEELINELALIGEIRQLLNKTLGDFEQQQIENRVARERLEYDWSDKREALEIDTINVLLNNNSPIILFCPGAIRQPIEQASDRYWEHFSSETMNDCELLREKSIALRATLDSILMNAARDIRTQADIVEKAFSARIKCTQENLTRFENELKTCLQKLADTEKRIDYLKRILQNFDATMKVAQTRMDNRGNRRNVENCRDRAQQGLIKEVDILQSSVSGVLTQLGDAENLKEQLMRLRSTLEREVMLKRRTLYIDQDRCMMLRSYYPSAHALSGFATI